MTEAASATDGWFIERGIGENRALLMADGEVIAAKILWPNELYAGQLVDAKLTSKTAGQRRGIAVATSGHEILIDHLPPEANEGDSCTVSITRAPIAEKGRFKLAQGRFTRNRCIELREWLADAREVHQFAKGAWEDIWLAASSGCVDFEGGSLVFSVTSAMTLIDVDGNGTPRELALAAAPIIADWIRAFDLGGSIGIDFPTIENKTDRKAVDDALGESLADWSHERTAMNGYGFVQIVARLEGPSLLHRFATSRVGLCARMAVRQAELADGYGPTVLLTVHPALKAKIKDVWLSELARKTGKQVRIETDPKLALESSQAQVLSA